MWAGSGEQEIIHLQIAITVPLIHLCLMSDEIKISVRRESKEMQMTSDKHVPSFESPLVLLPSNIKQWNLNLSDFSWKVQQINLVCPNAVLQIWESQLQTQQIHDWSSTFVVFRRLFVFAPFSAASTRSVRLHPHSPINMQRCLDIFLHLSTVQCIGKVFFIKLLLKPEGHRWWPVVCFRKHETASVFFLLLFCVTLSIQVLICKVFSPPMFSLGNVSSLFPISSTVSLQL